MYINGKNYRLTKHGRLKFIHIVGWSTVDSRPEGQSTDSYILSRCLQATWRDGFKPVWGEDIVSGYRLIDVKPALSLPIVRFLNRNERDRYGNPEHWNIGPLFHGQEAWELRIFWFVFMLFYEEPKNKRNFYFTKRLCVWIDRKYSVQRHFRRWFHRYIY